MHAISPLIYMKNVTSDQTCLLKHEAQFFKTHTMTWPLFSYPLHIFLIIYLETPPIRILSW